MKALVYEKAHSIEDFAIKLAEISEPILRELDVLVDVHAVGINQAKLSSARHAAQNQADVSCSVGNSRRIAENLRGEIIGKRTNPKYDSVVYRIPFYESPYSS